MSTALTPPHADRTPRGPAATGTRTPEAGERQEARYAQFGHHPWWLYQAWTAAAVLTWPIVWPLAKVSRRWGMLFRTVSEALSLLPYLIGIVVRGEFYRFALRKCGRNVVIEFGTVFIYPEISIGDHVLIGRYNTIHHCDFGSYVLTAEGCCFLSGSEYHGHERTDVPMALQGGWLKRISVADDCWIGSRAVVMANVGQGSIVGAASVVTRPVEEFTIVVGNPAQLLRRRRE